MDVARAGQGVVGRGVECDGVGLDVFAFGGVDIGAEVVAEQRVELSAYHVVAV